MGPFDFADPRRERLFRLFDERHADRGVRLMAGVALIFVALLAIDDAVGLAGGRGTALLWRAAMAAVAVVLLLSTFR